MVNFNTLIRLKSSVRFSSRHDGIIIMDEMSLAPILRVKKNMWRHLKSFEFGISTEEAGNLIKFAEKLAEYGLLEGSDLSLDVQKKIEKGKIYIFDPDPLALKISIFLKKIRNSFFLKSFYILLFIAFSLFFYFVILQIAIKGSFSVSVFGFFSYFIFYVPLHEFSHAVACRLIGARVSGLGIQYAGRLFPTPFVNTRNIALVESSRMRAFVCLAGPICDIFFGGFTGLILIKYPGNSYFFTLGFVVFFFLVFNLNPFRHSDLRNALYEWSIRDVSVSNLNSKYLFFASHALFIILFSFLLFDFYGVFKGYMSWLLV